jgi:hypothetical protein
MPAKLKPRCILNAFYAQADNKALAGLIFLLIPGVILNNTAGH